jgi:hypothetical protein
VDAAKGSGRSTAAEPVVEPVLVLEDQAPEIRDLRHTELAGRHSSRIQDGVHRA